MNTKNQQLLKFLDDKFVYLDGYDQDKYDLFMLNMNQFETYIMDGYEDYIAFNTLRCFKYDLPNVCKSSYYSEGKGGIYIKKDYYNCNDIILNDDPKTYLNVNTKAIIGHKKYKAYEGYSGYNPHCTKFDFNRDLTDFENYIDVEDVESVQDAFSTESKYYDTIISNATDLLHHHINIINNCAKYANKYIVICKVKKCNIEKHFRDHINKYVSDSFILTFYNTGKYKTLVLTRKIDYIKIFCHVYAINNWRDIIDRQIRTIKDSGMPYKLYIFAICKSGEVLDYIKNSIDVHNYIDTESNYRESFTLRNIRYFVEPDDIVIYLHNKGATRYGQTKLTIDDRVFAAPKLYENIEGWCKFMEYYLITKYEQCLEKIRDYDIVSTNYMSSPPHFAGNFWMTTGKYILSLPKNNSDETFLFKSYPKVWSMRNVCTSGYYPYFNNIYDLYIMPLLNTENEK
jgi:hypothetical protein